MAIARVQVAIPSQTGLPEDVRQNTLHFDTGAVSVANAADAIRNRLDDFYGVTVAPQTFSIASFLSIDLAAGPPLYKFYDQPIGGTPAPVGGPYPDRPNSGPPVAELEGNWSPFGSSKGLPGEVAACASFFNVRTDPRRRGRIYIGPLVSGAVEIFGGRARVIQTLRDIMATSSIRLVQDGRTFGVELVIYSRANDAVYPVVGGFVDDAFDTQRRRGTDPQIRDLWLEP